MSISFALVVHAPERWNDLRHWGNKLSGLRIRRKKIYPPAIRKLSCRSIWNILTQALWVAWKNVGKFAFEKWYLMGSDMCYSRTWRHAGCQSALRHGTAAFSRLSIKYSSVATASAAANSKSTSHLHLSSMQNLICHRAVVCFSIPMFTYKQRRLVS